MEKQQKFEDFDRWVQRASSWLTRRFPEERAICFDANLHVVRCGKDFREAEYPVRWLWPSQIVDAVYHSPVIWEIEALEEETVNFMHLPDLLDPCQKRTLRYILGTEMVANYIRKNIDADYR